MYWTNGLSFQGDLKIKRINRVSIVFFILNNAGPFDSGHLSVECVGLMAEYRLSPAAEIDLESIWLYTQEQWGIA